MPKAVSFIPHTRRIDRHRVDYLRAISEAMDDPFQTEDGREMRGVQLELANRCSDYNGVKYWQFTNCCTDALQISIEALTKIGDTIIVPSYGWRAFANAVLFMGRKLRFCDIDATGNIDLNQLADMIVKVKPAACIVVHNFGTVARVDQIEGICSRYGVHIIEDAAPAFYMGEPYTYIPGTKSSAACFSFDFTKYPGTLGSGGGICTNREDIANTIYEISAHGRSKSKQVVRTGTKSYLDITSCAVLLKEIELFEQNNYREHRRQIASWFNKNLPYESIPGENYVWERYTMSVPSLEVNEVIDKLNSVKCLAKTFFKEPLHSLPWLNTEGDECPKTTEFCNSTVHLPCHHYLTKEECDRILGALTW